MQEKIFLIVAVIAMYFLGTVTRKKILETKYGLMTLFLLFIALMTKFTVDLINHFSYFNLAIVVLFFIWGVVDYYKKFKRIQLK